MDSSWMRIRPRLAPTLGPRADAGPGGKETPEGARADSSALDQLIRQLEQQMPDLQIRHGNVFALANAWAERYDAILALAPRSERAGVEARLKRIGIRWGMMPGARITTEFRALGAIDDGSAFLPRK
jgi:hypothetical protein